MDTNATPGVYVWLKTTHRKGTHDDILDALSCAIAGNMPWFTLGHTTDDQLDTASEDLTRSVFVARLDTYKMPENANSSPLNTHLLSNMQGAVNASTGDSDRSNCIPFVLPYPPTSTKWVDTVDE